MRRVGKGDCHPRVSINLQQSNAVVNDEQLHQERGALEQGNVARRHAAQPNPGTGARQSHEQTDHAAAGKGDQR